MDLNVILKGFFSLLEKILLGGKGKKNQIGWIVGDVGEDWQDAKDFFLENLPAYRRGKIKWSSGLEKGARYNMVSAQKVGKGHKKVFISWKKHKDQTILHLIAENKISKDEYDRFKGNVVTWCNQVLSIFGYYCTGIDFDFFTGREFNANKISDNLANGYYNNEFARFAEVSKDYAIDAASIGGLSFISWHNPGKIGHVAVFEQDGSGNCVQAGLHTGENLSLEKCFGKKNLPKLKYWVYQVKE